MLIAPGTRLGPYEILAPIGAGGMGEVYRGRDTRLGRQVAIKVLPERFSRDKNALARFELEVKAVAALVHPNILAIYDIGVEEETSFAVTELLEGETLRERLDSATLSVRKAIEIALPIARGLAAAHDKGIVHRDLKPENVFITTDGRVKILDFGLAKLGRPEEEKEGVAETPTVSRHTMPGSIMGTVGYMSPEQARGQDADHRSDLFSFGATLYEMISGGRAFKGDSAMDVISAILREHPPDLSTSGKSVPPVLERIIGRCLEKSPTERFQSARDLAFALEAISDVSPDTSSNRASQDLGGSDTSPDPPSIAVLPFADMSPAKDQDYFCEGMAEEIINALTKIEGLQVASRSSALRFKGLAQDIRRIGETLNVKTVLEGSVRTAGKRLRVTTQLVNVKDGYHLWSERYDRQMEDVFDIQDEISESIVNALRVKLVGRKEPARGRHTSNLEAYHLYLKGQHNWYRRASDSLQKAAQFFEEAAEKDPSYVLAHTGLTNAYSSLGYYGLHHDIAYPKAKAAIERARSINDNLAEVQAALGLMQLWLELDWEGSEQSFKKAISIDPEYVLVHCWYSFLLNGMGRNEEALRMAERARDLDPLSPYTNSSLGFSLFRQGRHEDAIRATQKALEMEPDFLYTHWVLGGAYTLNAQHDEAISVLERGATLSERASYYLSWLAWCYGVAGRRDRALDIIEELDERSRTEHVAACFFAWAYAGLNDAVQTMDWLDKAVIDQDAQLSILGGLPIFDNLSSDPRFQRLLERLKLPGSK